MFLNFLIHEPLRTLLGTITVPFFLANAHFLVTNKNPSTSLTSVHKGDTLLLSLLLMLVAGHIGGCGFREAKKRNR